MKRKHMIYILIFLFLLLTPIISVFAKDAAKLYLCDQPGVILTFKFGGYALFIAKILVPIILIITASVDFTKAIIAGSSEEISKQTMVVAKRAVAGVIIFFIPTVIAFTFGLLDTYSSVQSEFSKCMTCLVTPSKCK